MSTENPDVNLCRFGCAMAVLAVLGLASFQATDAQAAGLVQATEALATIQSKLDQPASVGEVTAQIEPDIVVAAAEVPQTEATIVEQAWYKALVGGALYCRGPGGSFTMWVSESTMEWSTDYRSGPWERRSDGWWRELGNDGGEEQRIELKGGKLVFYTPRGKVKCKF